MAKKKVEIMTEAEEPEEVAGPKMSKAAAFRLVEAANPGIAPADGVEIMKAKYGLEMTPAAYSQYRSNEKNKGRAPAAGASGKVKRPQVAQASDMVSLGLVIGLQKLMEEYGAEETVKVLKVLQ